MADDLKLNARDGMKSYHIMNAGDGKYFWEIRIRTDAQEYGSLDACLDGIKAREMDVKLWNLKERSHGR